MIKNYFPVCQIPVGWCSLYDPVFSVSERETLRELGFTVLTENEVNDHIQNYSFFAVLPV